MTDAQTDAEPRATDRLLLNRPHPRDLDALHALRADPRVWQHFPSGRATDAEQTRGLLDRWMQNWERDGLGVWIVSERETGEFAGYGGCSRTRDAFWNLGYRLRPEVHGRGYATEVARAALVAAQRADPGLPVVAYLLEHNRASAAVAQRIGLSLRWRGPDAGNPDPQAVRLVFADRELTDAQLPATTA